MTYQGRRDVSYPTGSAHKFGPRLLHIEEQLTEVVSLKDTVRELEKAMLYASDTQQQLMQTTIFRRHRLVLRSRNNPRPENTGHGRIQKKVVR